MVNFVALLEAAQDGDGVFHRGLIHKNRLEPPFQRSVLLDVLLVLIERSRADAVQLAAREHRFEQVAGIHRSFGFAGADYGVEFVDEKNDAARGFLHFFKDRLEALFKFASILGPGDQRTHIQRDDPLVFDPLGNVPADDSLR